MMIFIALTVRFCSGNLFFIPYLFIYVLFPGFKPTSFRFKMKKKFKLPRGMEPASFKSAFQAATPHSFHMSVQLPHHGKKCCTTKDD